MKVIATANNIAVNARYFDFETPFEAAAAAEFAIAIVSPFVVSLRHKRRAASGPIVGTTRLRVEGHRPTTATFVPGLNFELARSQSRTSHVRCEQAGLAHGSYSPATRQLLAGSPHGIRGTERKAELGVEFGAVRAGLRATPRCA